MTIFLPWDCDKIEIKNETGQIKMLIQGEKNP
jgi:hypothetical protein